MKRLLLKLHHDDRGNLAILLLLTVWALTALIGMVWNSGEYAYRKRYVQTAADAAVHAGNLWVGRTTNLTAATNMVISENGSAEVILRAIEPTRQTIQTRFDSERKRATQLRDGDQVGNPEKNYPDTEYFEELLGFGQFAGNGRVDKRMKDLSALTPDINQAIKIVGPQLSQGQLNQIQSLVDRLRRNQAAHDYLQNQWLPDVKQSVGDWIEGQVRPRLDDILKTLDQEQQTLDQWSNQTAPATSTTPDQLRQARSDIFEYQKQIKALTPQAVEEQRAALATFYKCDLTYSQPGHPSDDGGPAMIVPPLQEAGDADSITQDDTIRQRYPQQTLAHFGTTSPSVTVDPINVNIDDAVIWHPGTPQDAPPGYILNKQQFQATFHVAGGDWGKVPCAPLSRFFNDRVSRDEQGLRQEPQQIDQTRTQLGSRLAGLTQPSVNTLPRQIPDPQTGKPAIPLPPERIPTLPIPPGLDAATQAMLQDLNQRIGQYNSDMSALISELRGLQNRVQQMYSNMNNLDNQAGQQFADNTWLNQVETARAYVLREMGWDKQFMILSTYKLRKIPDWAQDGMRSDVQQYVYNRIRSRNYSGLYNNVYQKLYNWASQVLGQQSQQQQQQGGRGFNYQSAARQYAQQNYQAIAQYVLDRAAQTISQEVADEWVLRPWPYEIAPPDGPVPPLRGISDDERKHNFTFVAAARSTDQTAARPFLPKAFDANKKPLVAFAQGETFNWMEYDANFGGDHPNEHHDHYDKYSDYGHYDMGGSPRPWRVSTTGGWNWQPRLSLSDALGEAIDDGPEFRSFLADSGVEGDDANALKTLTLH